MTEFVKMMFGSRGMMVAALMLATVLLVGACTSDDEPDPTAVPTAVPTVPADSDTPSEPATVPATSPSQADLGGGSPEAFGAVFKAAIEGSNARATSEFADAAQPLAAGEKLKVGFIFVGSEKDLGYNQAAYEGSLALQAAHPDIEILYAENIPETAEVQAIEEQMIQQGAKIIFATSYGYSDPTIEVANKHPEIIFLHQGALVSTNNFGAYFGNIWQLEYAAGQVAGRTTQTNKLGFVAAFPIPQTLLNVNAFQLGARSVNPDVTTTFVLTGSWCDPAKQAAAAQAMLDSGVDVLTQHQDCTGTLTRAAERAGVFVTGYHQDASSAAPNGWLTGAVWNWGPIYSELVAEIKNGTYKASVFFAGLEEGFVKLAPFGENVPEDIKQQALDTVEGLRDGTIKPFDGPILDQDGEVRFAEGVSPSDEELQTIDWLVDGIQGSVG